MERKLYQMKPGWFRPCLRQPGFWDNFSSLFQESALLDQHCLVSSFALITLSTWKCSHWQGPHHQNECVRNSPLNSTSEDKKYNQTNIYFQHSKWWIDIQLSLPTLHAFLLGSMERSGRLPLKPADCKSWQERFLVHSHMMPHVLEAGKFSRNLQNLVKS